MDIENVNAMETSSFTDESGLTLPSSVTGVNSPIVNKIEIISDDTYNKYVDDIKGMNFLEATLFRNNVRKELEELPSQKQMAESVINLKQQSIDIQDSMQTTKDNSYGAKIVEENAKSDIDVDNLEAFIDQYDTIIEKVTSLKDLVDEKINEFNDIPKTTKYMNDLMIAHINNKLNAITEKTFNKERIRKYYSIMLVAFSSRESFDYIERKISNRRVQISSSFKKMTINDAGTKARYIAKVFANIFTVEQIKVIYDELIKIFKDDERVATYVLYLIASIYEEDRKAEKGFHKFCEVCMMNLLNIAANEYDMPNGMTYYTDQIEKLCKFFY